MKKHIDLFVSLLIAAISVTSCAIQGADGFSKDPTAPVMTAHNDILITPATLEEDVVFSWQKARFLGIDNVRYTLHAVVGESDAVIASDIDGLAFRTQKSQLREKLLSSFSLAPNATHNMSFYVSVKDNSGKALNSDKISLNIYLYDNAVPAVVESVESVLILDKENPGEMIDLLVWESARLVYGEEVSYTVMASVGENKVKVASGLDGNSFSLTADELNEVAVSAGAVEEQASDVTFSVLACCESIPEGIASNGVVINITTYVATFPETLYIPGSYQGWNPASAPTLKLSKSVKGQYEGFVDLRTDDMSDVQFKFSPFPEWKDDFSFGEIEVTKFGEGNWAHVTGKGIVSDNIVCPSGIYYMKVSKKFNTIELVQVERLSLIGGFNSWSADEDLIFDPAKNTWSTVEPIEMTNGTEYKIRFNHDWTYSFGGKESEITFGGENIAFEKADGKYLFVLNVAGSPFTMNAVDINMPDKLIIAGDYGYGIRTSTWNPTDQCPIFLKDSGKGIYKGYISMFNAQWKEDGCEFKVVKNGNEWIGGTLISSENGEYLFALGDGGNMFVPFGHYYFEVDMINGTAKLVSLEKTGIIGSFEPSGWGSDVDMTYNAETGKFTVEQAFAAGNEFKFRFNGDWSYNLGESGSTLVHDGSNIVVAEAGTYLITLDLMGDNAPEFKIEKK